MPQVHMRKVALARLSSELKAGKPVMLVPISVPFQRPSDDFVLIPVVGVQPQFRADLLRVDICGDSGIILFEVSSSGG